MSFLTPTGRRRGFALLIPLASALLGFVIVKPKEGIVNQIAYFLIIGMACLFTIYVYPSNDDGQDDHHKKNQRHPHDHEHHKHHRH
jgi:ABC-type nickel/cobalt efflux system permease component RcnA